MEGKAKPENDQLAVRLQELRRIYRHTQQECADALGISQPSYAEMERGETRIRRRDMVTIATLYGLTLEVAFPGLADAAVA